MSERAPTPPSQMLAMVAMTIAGLLWPVLSFATSDGAGVMNGYTLVYGGGVVIFLAYLAARLGGLNARTITAAGIAPMALATLVGSFVATDELGPGPALFINGVMMFIAGALIFAAAMAGISGRR